MAAEAESVHPVLVLHRYIAIKGGNGMFLALKPDGVLAFDAPEVTRLATHEVVYNADVRGRTFAMRSANNRFWIRDSDDDQIRAVQENPPKMFHDDARFNVVKLVDTGFLAFQSPGDDLFLKRDSLGYYKALETTPCEYAQVEVSDASAYAIPLPPKAYFEMNDKRFLLTSTSNYIRGSAVSYPPSEHTDVVTLLDGNLSLCNPSPGKGYWTAASSGCLHTDAADRSAHFEPQRNMDSTISFRSAGTGKLIGNDGSHDLKISDSETGTSFTPSRLGTQRQIYDVKYLLRFVCITDCSQHTVASGQATNTSSRPMDLSIDVLVVSDLTSSTMLWSDRFNFKEKYLKTSLTAAVPILTRAATCNREPEIEFTSANTNYPWNETVEDALKITMNGPYVIKNVQPGATASVIVQCNTARVRIPFTYKSKTDREAEEKGIDGMFDATYVFNLFTSIDSGTNGEDMRRNANVEFRSIDNE